MAAEKKDKDTEKKSDNLTAKGHEEQFMSMATPQFAHDFLALIKSRQPLACITTQEETRFLSYMQYLCSARGYEGFIWDCYRGLCRIADLKKAESAGTEDTDPDVVLDKIIEQIEKLENDKSQQDKKIRGTLYFLLDFERFIYPSCSPETERRLKWIVRTAKRASVILVGPTFRSTPSIDKDIAVLDFPYPNDKELKAVLYQIVDSVKDVVADIKSVVSAKEEELVNACKGLTIAEAQGAYSQSVVMAKPLGHEPFNIGTIIKQKKQIIRKSGILEYHEPDVKIDDVGGLDRLIDWLQQRQLAFSNDAREYGLDIPKGILLLGHPGTGKSLSAKATASLFKVPLLRLDFGKLFGSLVGESEKTSRDAIKLAESLAPCVSGQSTIYDQFGNPHVIEDLMKENSEVQGDFYTFSMNEKTNRLEKTLVKRVIKKTVKPMIRINTAAGSLTVTKDHGLMAGRDDGITKWTMAEELGVGDLLLTSRVFPREVMAIKWHQMLRSSCNVSVDGGASFKIGDLSYCALDTTGPSDYVTKPCSKSIELTVNKGKASYTANLSNSSLLSLGYLLGAVESSGCIDREKKTITFTHAHSLYDFVYLLASVLKIEPVIEGHAATITNPIFYDIMTNLSDRLMQQPKHVIGSYLAGWIDMQGDIFTGFEYPKLLINMSWNTKMADRVRCCFKILGILDVQSNEKLIFLDRNVDIVQLIEEIYVVRKDLLEKYRILVERNFDPAESKDYVSVSEHPDNDTKIADEQVHVQSKDFMAVRIISIEPAPDQMAYDLTCEGNNNFFANGLLCHNCILWTDELEKGLSGSRSSGDTDGGTTSRVISTFLTWMQEKTAPVFVIATANNVEDIPPEFMRAGRFDEIFFVDLPTKKGRVEIYKILLKKRHRDPAKFDLDKIANRTKWFSGAEIEKTINTACFRGFSENKRDIDTKDILAAADTTKPLATTRSEEFKKRRDWAESRCVFANNDHGDSTEEIIDIADMNKTPGTKGGKSKVDLDLQS